MKNPWEDLPTSEPFALPVDAPVIARFNDAARPEFKLRLNVLPEPFLGNPNAPVVLLGLNPGYADEDIPIHRDPAFIAANRANLLHQETDYPLYLLNPSLRGPGQDWWRKHLRALIAASGIRSVASNIFVLELLGYHSVRFGHGQLRLPSQQYVQHLLRAAINRNALVVFQRGMQLWQSFVPALRSYDRAFRVRNWQNPAISYRNCPEAFEAICAATSSAA